MRYLLTCVLLVTTTDLSLSARILAVLPMPARSHHNMFQGVLTALAERGHQVVNYTPAPINKPIPNYMEFHLDNVVSPDKSITKEVLTAVMNISPVRAVELLWKVTHLIKSAFENEKLQKLLLSTEKYDLVILEAQLGQEFLLAFGHKFNAPVVSLHPFGSFSLVNKVSGNSLALAYIPDFAFPSSDHMTFYERLLSSYSILSSLYSYYTQFLPAQEEYMRTLFKDPTVPPLVDMLHNISLFINNAHPYVHYAQPYTPNLIPVGGIHLSKEQKPLPTTMKKFLDEAKHGVIYLSLGSVVPDYQLPQKFFDNFVQVFRRLPQRVLWKTGAEPVGLPDNVLTSKWVPQQDILAHPNVVLFMTHGGVFSQHEAINAGVPVVCVPFFADQPLNAKFYTERGIGVQLNFDSLSEETIYSALTTVLNNPKYKENAVRLSHIYRDRPMSPADSAVFWIEYVLRHRGAPHLRPASSALSWYQLALLDVLAAVLAVISLIIVVVYMVIRKLLTIMRGNKHKKTTTSKKTN